MTQPLTQGLLTFKSPHSVQNTADRLVSFFESKDITVFARINHALGAAKVDLSLRPTEVIIFGNPKTGTPLIIAQQTAAIDLPQKSLIWEDDAGQVWLAFNDPHFISERHQLTGCETLTENLSNAFRQFAEHAVAP